MNKAFIKFIVCMILSVAVMLMMSVGVFADKLPEEGTEPSDEIVDGEVVDGEEEPEEELPAHLTGAGFLNETEMTIPLTLYDDYEYVCGDEKNGMAMYYDAKGGTGLFYLQKIVDGEVVRWHSTAYQNTRIEDPTIGESIQSMRSQIIIESVSRAEMATKSFAEERSSRFDCIGLDGAGLKNLKVVKKDNGLKISYTFPSIGVTVPVEYTIKDGKFYATVVIGEIDEGKDHYLININLLPALGVGTWEEDGYVLIPDGSGAIMDFNNGAFLELGYRQYEAKVYGEDMAIVEKEQVTYKEDIRLPVFGIVKNNNALYGIITKGDGAASIVGMSGNSRFGYNGVSSIFHYRVMQKQMNLFNKRDVNFVAQPKFGKDDKYQVCYDVLFNEEANYMGIASAYRDYLKDAKALKRQDTTPKFHMDAIGAFEQDATFLGIIPYTETVTLTTYEQCATILGELKSAGISNLTLRYLGWSNNGVENKELPDEAASLSALGGSDGMKTLQEYTNKNGIKLFPDVDLLRFQESGNGVSARSAGIRTVFGKIAYQPKYMLSTYVTVLGSEITATLSPEKISWAAERYMASLLEENFKAVSLSTLGDFCYSNFYEDNEQYRYYFPERVAEVLSKYAGKAEMSFEGGNAYVLPYASLITNVPIHSSGYDVLNQDVPFYQAVLHGWIPYTTESIPQAGNPEATYLAAVETGSELLYVGIYEKADVLFDTEYDHFYGSTYTLWMKQAVAQYKEYMPLLQKIHDQEMTMHGELMQGVYLTGYENGVQTVVNYNDKAVTLSDGTEVAAMGFVTGENKWSLAKPEPEPTPDENPEEVPEDGLDVGEGEGVIVDDEEGDEVIG